MSADPIWTLMLKRLDELRLQVADLQDAVREAAGSEVVVADAAPLTTWTAVAEACGVSVDTLKRRRTERNDQTPPFFADSNAARQWYRNLLAPSPHPVSVPKRRSPPTRPARGLTLAELKAQKRRK